MEGVLETAQVIDSPLEVPNFKEADGIAEALVEGLDLAPESVQFLLRRNQDDLLHGGVASIRTPASH